MRLPNKQIWLPAMAAMAFCATAAISEPFPSHHRWKHLEESPEAVLEASDFIKLHPSDPEGYFRRSQARGENKRTLHLALADAQKAIALGGKHSSYFYREAFVLDAMEDDVPALAAIDKACDLEAHEGQYWYLRSIIYYHLRRNDQALKSADKAIACKPKNSDYHLIKGRALKGEGNLEASLKELETALTLMPGSRSILKEKLDVLQRLNRWPSALSCAANLVALEKDPIEMLRIRQARANCYIHLKDFSKAAADYKEALKLFPDDPQTHRALAGVYDQMGKKKEAEAERKTAHGLEEDLGAIP